MLGEISNNQEDPNAFSDATATTATKKPASKAKKGKGSKKTKKRNADLDGKNCQVLEDENQSGSSSAVEDACEELMKRNNNEGLV